MSAANLELPLDGPCPDETPSERKTPDPADYIPADAISLTAKLEAIDWLRLGVGASRHRPGCLCRRCPGARSLARAAILNGHDFDECGIADCAICWARRELFAGRL